MSPPRLRLICLGDSLTLGIASPELEKWPVRLALALEQQFPGVYELFIRAYNGATTTDALGWIEGEVGYLLPGVVLVTLGVNDALVRPTRQNSQVGLEDFRRNLEEIHRFVVGKGGKMILVIEHIPEPDQRPAERRFYVAGNGKSYRENYEPYCHAVAKIGAALGVSVIDLPALLAKGRHAPAELIMEDGLHLSSAGNAAYAHHIFQSLREILPGLHSHL